MTDIWQGTIEDLQGFIEHTERNFDYGPDGFTELDSLLKSNLYGFVRVGLLADWIRRYRLWEKGKYDSFADYCKRGLGKTFWAIQRTIDAAKVVMNLISEGFKILPQCESQCRPLIKAAGGSECAGILADVWGEVVAAYKEQDKITASSIDSIINRNEPEKASTKLSKDTLKELKEQADAEGISIDELLRELLRDRREASIVEPMPSHSEIVATEELSEVVSQLEQKFAHKNSPIVKTSIVETLDRSVDAFDRQMDGLIGKFIPKVRLE